jgi:hypothetical protein
MITKKQIDTLLKLAEEDIVLPMRAAGGYIRNKDGVVCRSPSLTCEQDYLVLAANTSPDLARLVKAAGKKLVEARKVWVEEETPCPGCGYTSTQEFPDECSKTCPVAGLVRVGGVR